MGASMTSTNITNQPDNQSLLLPLKISSYNSQYINIFLNETGVSIKIPEQQIDIEADDKYEIYYAPVMSNGKLGQEILVSSNTISGSVGDYVAPNIITPKKFFPKVEHQVVRFWYAITKNEEEKISSPYIEQFLATEIKF